MAERQIPIQETVEEVAPGLIRITVENGEWSFGTPNYYLLIGETEGIIVDSGTGSSSEFSLFRKTWQKRGQPKIAGIVVTHSHFDHSGGIRSFSALVDAEIIGGKGMAEDKREIDLGGRTVTIIPTPGHTRDSLCVLDSKSNALFTGDTIIEDKSVVVQDMSAYWNTLEELKWLAPAIIYPGHGNTVENGTNKIQEYIARTHRRERTIERFIQRGLTDVRSLTNRMYGDKSSAGHQQVKAHIEKLEKEGRIIAQDGKLQLAS